MKAVIGGLISMLFVANVFASNPVFHDPDDPMRSKKFSKTFSVGSNDKVNLSNSFGDILIKVWEKRQVQVDVSVDVYSKDEADAERLLNQANIESGKNGDEIYFKTSIGVRGGQYGSKVKNGRTIWRREVKVNYVVYMPASNALILSNQYGNVIMGNFSGTLSAKVQYGNFTAGNLTGPENYLHVQYGKTTVQKMEKAVINQQYGAGLVLGTVGTLELKAQYAGVSIGNIKGDAHIKQQYGQGLNVGAVDNLNLDAQYVNVNVGTIHGNANVKQQYNNISIGSVNKLNLKGEYATVKIASLRGDGIFSVSYDRLTVENINPACKNLIINADYSHVALGFSDNYHADFDIKVGYSKFSYGSRVVSKLLSDSSNSKVYSGKIGSGGDSNVVVKSEYGSLRFL